MPNTTISIEFPEYKIKAIEQALREKEIQQPIAEILVEHLDGLYQRHVPAQARKYLDVQFDEQAVSDDSSAPSRRRQSRRQAQEQEESTTPILERTTAVTAESEQDHQRIPQQEMGM